MPRISSGKSKLSGKKATGSLFPPEKPATIGRISLTAHIDGGARGNPGPAGFGAHIEDANGKTVAELSEFLGHRTNNYAEYAGLIAALEYAVTHQHRGLRVVSDSELLVKQLLGDYKVKSPELKILYDEARRLIRQLDSFEIAHVLRHKNLEADRLANQAMDLGSKRNNLRVEASNFAQTAPSRISSPN